MQQEQIYIPQSARFDTLLDAVARRLVTTIRRQFRRVVDVFAGEAGSVGRTRKEGQDCLGGL